MAAHKKQFCINGHDTHIVGRHPTSRACRKCTSIRSYLWWKAHPEAAAAKRKSYAERYPEKVAEYRRLRTVSGKTAESSMRSRYRKLDQEYNELREELLNG